MDETWLAASLALVAPLAWAVIDAGRGRAGRRLIALQLASSLAVLLLVGLTFSFGQPSSIDVALAFALLTLPGILVMTLFFERWL